MDTVFAKIVSSPNGRNSILIEGMVIGLDVADTATNNRYVEAIVTGLRRQAGNGFFTIATAQCAQNEPEAAGAAAA